MEEPREGDECGRPGEPVAAPDARARIAFCRQAAQQVLRRHNITEPPVPVEDIIRRLGLQIQINREVTSGVVARLRTTPEGKAMELAPGQPRVRQRFSMAHELGHHVLGHALEPTPVAEAEANTFAGALLVPREWLARDLKGERMTAAALAQRYDVSQEVIFIAVKDGRLLQRLR